MRSRPGGDGGHAPSRKRAFGSRSWEPVPLGPMAAHEPTPTSCGAWVRRRSPSATS